MSVSAAPVTSGYRRGCREASDARFTRREATLAVLALAQFIVVST
jgi:hypothetical protein